MQSSQVVREDLKEDTAIIDADVHPLTEGRSLLRYMPDDWRRRFEVDSRTYSRKATKFPMGFSGHLAVREDSKTPSGAPGGSDPQFAKSDFLDKYNIGIAILNELNTGRSAIDWGNTDDSIIINRAYNDYFLDKWLPVDDRYRYTMCIPIRDQIASVEEIHRLGKEKGVIAIQLPLLNIAMGNRYYWPIYEAACKENLPIYMHTLQGENAPQMPGQGGGLGSPESRLEGHNLFPVPAEAYLNSLVCSGTLERFPNLRVIFAEYGFTWALPMMWRMDKNWRGLRDDSPWVKKPPSEYVREQVRFTTQPLPEPRNQRDLAAFIQLMGEELLLFSSDYPHWDNDMPINSLAFLPQETKSKIYRENAKKFLKL